MVSTIPMPCGMPIGSSAYVERPVTLLVGPVSAARSKSQINVEMPFCDKGNPTSPLMYLRNGLTAQTMGTGIALMKWLP